MKAEDDTREIFVSEPRHDQDDSPTPDLGLWGADAVPLDKDERKRQPTESTRRAGSKLHRWVAPTAIVCVTGLIIALGANATGGKTGSQIEKPWATQTRGQPPLDEHGTNGGTAARQVEQRQQQAHTKSHQSSIHSTRPTHPAPSPTYAPASDPARAPVVPSPAPDPAPAPSSTTKPPPASGPAVAEEFGFER